MALGTKVTSKVKAIADKIGGVSRIDNETNPASAAYKMKHSMAGKIKFTPRPTSNGIGVGP